MIAILAAILLPSLQKARERGKISSCQGQLKQLGTVMLQYADDHNGWGASDTYWGGPANWSTVYADYLPSTVKNGKGFFNSVVCPGWQSATTVGAINKRNSTETYLYTSYNLFFGIGSRLQTQNGSFYGWNLKSSDTYKHLTYNRQIPRLTMCNTTQKGRPGDSSKAVVSYPGPSKQMILVDRNDISRKFTNGKRPSHSPGNNLCFADGHVEYGAGLLSSATYVALTYDDEMLW